MLHSSGGGGGGKVRKRMAAEQEQVTTLLPRKGSELEKSGVGPQAPWGAGPWGERVFVSSG